MNPSYTDLIQRAWNVIKNNLGLSVGLTIVVSLAAMVLNMIPIVGGFLLTPFSAGYIVCLLKLRKNEEFSWGDFFWAFLEINRILHLAFLSLLITIGTIVGTILLIIPGIWFGVASSLATPIFILGEQDGMAALKKSLAVIKNRWWWFFGFLIVLALLNIAGALCLFFGLLFTIPVSALALVMVYEHFAEIAPIVNPNSTPAPMPTPIN